jgi:NADH-quinone oxidoreductase subunit L
MVHVLEEHPGLWFVAATLLPLVSVVLLLLAGGLRNALRSTKNAGGLGASLFHLLGGEVTGRGPAYIATAAIGLAFVCSLTGFILFLGYDHHGGHDHGHHQAAKGHEGHKHDHKHDHKGHQHGHDHGAKGHDEAGHAKKDHQHPKKAHHNPWADSIPWAAVRPLSNDQDPHRASELRVGYYIDHLSAIMFVMVTFIATLIHIFSIGYMSDELQQTVEDHQVHSDHGHYHRRGRFGRFFLFLSLFCFSMLNLILADNLFQVFVSWELVGVCSYLLIGFYYERTSAANAANKAFITNRVGDAGFIIGLLIVWTYMGTLNFQEIFARVRCPDQIEGTKQSLGGQIVRTNWAPPKILAEGDEMVVSDPGKSGQFALLFPRHQDHEPFPGSPAPGKILEVSDNPTPHQYSYIPYWLLVAAGLGIFLGCVGKSAQFPLQVWLPDAMEGPTPVSALIHAATMVAAGVYLVGRCFPLFTYEVTLTIAYTGGITLFVAATIAIVMNDIKKVLAYSTVSQLGFMMLALGVGGWAAGLFHLITHAFFKALLFLGSGSVIYGCHHEQDMRKMGGLYPKMKITALTMLMGVLAIAGIPMFSGWYSKDAILAHALGFVLVHPEHMLLFLLPLFTAGITTFYMFRMWLMTFAGTPKDEHVYEHAHESPPTMTVPLIVLAFFSVTVGWGWPFFSAHFPFINPEASWLEHEMHHAQPRSVTADFGFSGEIDDNPGGHLPFAKPLPQGERFQAMQNHETAGNLALGVVAIGLVFAFSLYYFRVMDPADALEQFPGVHNFLERKWYFDELYSVALVRPSLVVAQWARWFDINVIDGFIHMLAKATVVVSFLSGLSDRNLVDGFVNLIARVCQAIGDWLRGVQTGYIRSYVLFLVLAALGLWILLSVFLGTPAPAAVP